VSDYDKTVRTARLPTGIPPRSCGSVAHRSWQLSVAPRHPQQGAPADVCRLCNFEHARSSLGFDAPRTKALLRRLEQLRVPTWTDHRFNEDWLDAHFDEQTSQIVANLCCRTLWIDIQRVPFKFSFETKR
jgi:hypothetical protein